MRVSRQHALICLRFLSSLPFGVFYASSVLFLNAQFQTSWGPSSEILGCFLALNYALAILGGQIANRYISTVKLLLVSYLLQAIGCAFFIASNINVALLFMAIFLTGAMGNTVSINLLLTELFKPEDVGRERAFYWYYIAMNLGYLVGYTVGGWLLNILSKPNCLFLLLFITQFMSAGMLVVAYKNQLRKQVRLHFDFDSFRFVSIWSGLSVLLFLVIWFALQNVMVTHSVVILIAVVIISYLCWNAKRLAARHQYLTFTLYYLVNMAFWSVYFLAPLALLVFINHFVDLSIAGFQIPPQWIQNINPGVILLSALLSPFLYGVKPQGVAFPLPIYFSAALSLMGLGFLVLFVGSYMSAGSVNIIWIILSYILQSLGELCIGPIGFALVGRLIPVKHHGIYSGAWILTLGIGGALSSLMSGKIMSGHAGLEQSNFQIAFLVIAIFCMVIGLLLWGFRHILQQYTCASETT